MQLDQLKRRDFITLLGDAAMAWPLGVRAQQPRMLRIGTVSAINPRTEFFWVAFDQRMRELGQIRAGDQPKTRQSDRRHHTAISACYCRRGDRVSRTWPHRHTNLS